MMNYTLCESLEIQSIPDDCLSEEVSCSTEAIALWFGPPTPYKHNMTPILQQTKKIGDTNSNAFQAIGVINAS